MQFFQIYNVNQPTQEIIVDRDLGKKKFYQSLFKRLAIEVFTMAVIFIVGMLIFESVVNFSTQFGFLSRNISIVIWACFIIFPILYIFRKSMKLTIKAAHNFQSHK